MSLSKYPEKLDVYQLKRDAAYDTDPNGDYIVAQDVNELQDAILSIEQTLGVNPQGNKLTVGERIGLLESSSSLRVPSFLLYLGKPSAFNEATNINEAITQYSKYDHIVLTSSVDASENIATTAIIKGIKENRDAKIYGYIDCGGSTINLSIEEIGIKIKSWKDMGATGIYCGNFGFEKNVSRERQNEILDAIHDEDMIAILQAARPEEVFTDAEHTTMNPGWIEPNIKEGDTYHLEQFVVDTSLENPYKSFASTLLTLDKLYDYRKNLGVRIFGTPLIQSTVSKEQGQAYYDYAHVAALLASLDAFHPAVEGYGATTDTTPSFHWLPLTGGWYSTSPAIQTTGSIYTRETSFGKLSLDEANNSYRAEGLYIPYNLLKFALNSIDGASLQDATIEDDKIKEYKGQRLIDAINKDIDGNLTINVNRIANLGYDNIGGDVPQDVLEANVIQAINANIGIATIGGAVIGDLTADHIKSGTISAERLRASVIDAINAKIGEAVIDQARIGDLHANKITAGDISAERLKAAVISAINLSAKQADIENLNADNISVGNVDADRMQVNVINAINTYTDNMTAESAVMKTAAIGELTAGSMKANIIEAINAEIREAKIDAAQIKALTADHIKATVVEALNAYIETMTAGSAKIGEAVIGDLSATKITSGDINADRLKATIMDAINFTTQTAVISQAKIADLDASKITAGTINAERLKSSIVEAVNLYAASMTVDSAKINQAAIGDLSADKITAGDIDAERLKATVVAALNLYAADMVVGSATIDGAVIDNLSADRITAGDISAERLQATVIDAIKLYVEDMVVGSAKIDGAVIGDLTAEHITSGSIDADIIKATVVEAINTYTAELGAQAAKIGSAAIGVLDVAHMQAKVLSAINASVETIGADFAKINKAKIGQLDADNIEANAITTEKLNADSVTATKIATDAIETKHIKAGQVTADEIAANAVTAEKIIADSIDATKIKTDAIETKHIKAGQVTADEIATNAVIADKILAGAIETTKLAADSVTTEKIAAGAITATEIAADAVTAIKIKAGEIDTGHLAANSVKANQIEAGAIVAGKLATDSVVSTNIQAGQIQAGHIVANAIETQHIKAGQIQTNHIHTDGLNANIIKSGTIHADRILFGSITGDKILAGTIQTTHMQAGSIDGSVIKGDTIHGSKIIAGTLTASNLIAGSITSVEIAAKTIQTRNLAAGAVDANVLRAGTITAEHISTIGLDATQIEVFGKDGQVLIGDGFLRIDGLDAGVVQSDNLAGNGLFLTASSAFGYLRDNPVGEAVLGSQTKIPGSHQIWRIDTTTGQYLAIDTGGTKPVDIAVDSDYEYAYVTLQGEDKLAQIQVSQGTTATRTGKYLNLGKGPGRIVYTGGDLEDHKHFFVLNTDPKDVNIPDTLGVIDAPPVSIASDLYLHHLIPVGNTPWDAVVKHVHDHNGNHVSHNMQTFVTLANQGDIAVIDTSYAESYKWKVIRNIPIAAHMGDNYHGGLDGRFGLNLATGGDASNQYGTNSGHAMHSHGHGGYGSSDGSLRTYTPHGIADSADENHIYVTDYANGHLLVIDIHGGAPYNPLTGTRMAGDGTGDGGDGGHTHSISTAEENIFSIQAGGHTGHDDSDPIHTPGFNGVITQEEQTTKWVRYRIPVGDSPESIKIVNGKIFITLEGSHQVAVIDESSILNELALDETYYSTWEYNLPMRTLPTWNVRTIDVGARPTYMTANKTTNELYVTVNGQNQIARIDTTNETVTARYNTGPNPKGTAISPDGAHIYVVNHGGSGNLSFVYPSGAYIGDAYLGLEGGVEYQGAEHWAPSRSEWVYNSEDITKVQSATTIEFHVNEPFLNEGGFVRLSSYGVDPQWATVEQDIYNVVNYSNGSNVAFATGEQLKQDSTLIRFHSKNPWLREYGVKNITIYAKKDEYLTRDLEDNRIFYPSKNWINSPERPVILVGLSGDFVEISEGEYTVTYGSGAKIVFNQPIAGDQEVYSSAYYYSEIADPTKYTIYYEDDTTDVSAGGTTYVSSHLTFITGYLPQGCTIQADYTFKHNRWFKSHNGSVLVATENSSSQNFSVQFEVDEFVPKYITIDNQQTEPFTYWPIEVPGITNADYTGMEYSMATKRSTGATVTSSVAPTLGALASITDGKEPADSDEEHSAHAMTVNVGEPVFDIQHTFGEIVTFPGGLQHVIVDMGKTYMIGKIVVTHAFHQKRMYHQTKTEVSEDGINWITVYDSAVSGEYREFGNHEAHDHTHYGKVITFSPKRVRYVRDWANGYAEYTVLDPVNAPDDWTFVAEYAENHWTEIHAYGDWEFEKEFTRNYTNEMLNKNPASPTPIFIKGNVTATGGSVVSGIGTNDEKDVTRIIDNDLLSSKYFSLGNGAATVTVDLGSIEKVDAIRVFRYYADVRTHKGVKTEISTNGTTWTTIYDSAVNGEYAESPGGKVIELGALTDVRYIRDTAASWTATLKTGTVITGTDIRWVGIHAYLDYNADYPYIYPDGSELEGQNLATNGQGVVTTSISGAYAAVDIPIDFTSWWYMTYLVSPEFGQVDIEMPTVMGGSHSLFQDAPYLNKIAHRHIMSWPKSNNIKEDITQGIKAGKHRAVIRQSSGKVSIDRLRFEDYQYLYMNSTEIRKGNATNFRREKIEPEVAKWYVGRGNQSTEGAYDNARVNSDTGKPDGSVAIKYRFRIKTRLQPSGLREERGIAYATSAIFETGRLSSHWRMSQAQDSIPGNRLQFWDPNQPHKTGIQNHHLANGAIRGDKIMPFSIMDHHVSSYAKITESKLQLNYPTHTHGHWMTMDGMTMWHDNKDIVDSIQGWGTSGTQDVVARADHEHPEYLKVDAGGTITADVTVNANIVMGTNNTVDGVDISAFKGSFDTHVGSADLHFSVGERTKLSGIATGATKVASSTNGKVLINDVDTTIYAHPSGDGNLHVPASGTTNNGKFLKAKSATAGDIGWVGIDWSDVASKPTSTVANIDLTVGAKHTQNTDTGTTQTTFVVGSGTASSTAMALRFSNSVSYPLLRWSGTMFEVYSAYSGTPTWSEVRALKFTKSDGIEVSYVGHTHSYNDLTDKPTSYTLPTASATTLGGIKIGSNLTIDGNGVLSAQNSYVHPSTDGSLHVPATGTSNNGKVLKAGNAASTFAWSSVDWSELTNVPSTISYSGHTHVVADITDLGTTLSNYATKSELALAGEVKLANNNTFTGQNIFTKADGPAIIIKPSATPSANTLLMQIANTSGTNMVTIDAEGDVIINANLTVQGTTTYSGTNTVTGSYSISENLTVGGNAVLGDAPTDQTTVKGDLVVEGSFKPKGKSLEVARFPVYGIGGDLQFQSDSTTYEEIIQNYWTFSSVTEGAVVPPVGTGAERRFKVMVSYSTLGAASAAQFRITQDDGTTPIVEFTLPTVTGASNSVTRQWMSSEFTTAYIGHTRFKAASAGTGKDLTIKYIEVIAYDYYA